VPEVPITNADFIDWVRTYSGPRFNFLHCDFPYGINAGRHNQGAGRALGAYDDSEDTHHRLVEALGHAMAHVVAEQAHLMFWFPIERHQTTLDALTAMGWKVVPVPLIWHKSDNTGILPDPNRSARRIYETAFMASRGDRKIVQAVGNSIGAPVTKSIHMSEKPKAVLRHFFRMFVDDSTRMLDPTCGSGNAVAVAEDMGASSVLGLEIDPEFCERAQAAYAFGNETVVA
jgi:tRNA1(Val) A37 N6-methylase TrmN6